MLYTDKKSAYVNYADFLSKIQNGGYGTLINIFRNDALMGDRMQ